MIFDHLTLRDIVDLSATLRHLGDGATSMEETAQRVVRHLRAELLAETGAPATVLIRAFITHELDTLPGELLDVAIAQLRAEGVPTTDNPACLTLLATSGERPEWEDRASSVAHRVIPLPSADALRNAPMISALFGQLGIDPHVVLNPGAGSVSGEGLPFNIFHVVDAVGSPQVPAQGDFVQAHGVRSVIGFGGVLPTGRAFAIIIFSRVRIVAEVAQLLRPVALAVKLAFLPFDQHVVFSTKSGAGEPPRIATNPRAATLEQLLNSVEITAREQTIALDLALERLRHQVAVAEEAALRLRLLAEVTTVLTGTLAAEEGLRRLARLVVPQLSDWAVVDLITEPGRAKRVAVEHRDPRVARDGKFTGSLPAILPDSQAPLARVLRGGERVLLTNIPSPGQASSPLDVVELELYAELTASSVIVAPLRARGRVLGALTLVRTADGSSFSQDEVTMVEDLARRAALAVDNARIFELERGASEVLQRSMLTELPKVDGLQFAARYVSAGEGAQIGGDWYDAFVLPNGDTALVIGDVTGHDMAAAAAMGQLRNLLRGIAVDTGEPAALVMARMDRAMGFLQPDQLATAIYATVCLESTGDRALRWCNAGHPAPLLVLADGTSRLLDSPADLLLGVDPTMKRAEGFESLPPGSTLVLYTDGLVEDRAIPIDVGLLRLVQTAGALATEPLEAFCDLLLTRMAHASDDDLALLALRLP